MGVENIGGQRRRVPVLYSDNMFATTPGFSVVLGTDLRRSLVVKHFTS